MSTGGTDSASVSVPELFQTQASHSCRSAVIAVGARMPGEGSGWAGDLQKDNTFDPARRFRLPAWPVPRLCLSPCIATSIGELLVVERELVCCIAAVDSLRFFERRSVQPGLR